MNSISLDAYETFHRKWALVSAGTPEDHNGMTISWGGLGCLWNRSVATVYVRPNRHTYQYMENNDYFTVSFYPDSCKEALKIMGSCSGRDCNKSALAGLTPTPAGESVTFAQAEVTLLCKKLFCQDLDKRLFPADIADKFYGDEPAHRMYIGEIISVIA